MPSGGVGVGPAAGAGDEGGAEGPLGVGAEGEDQRRLVRGREAGDRAPTEGGGDPPRGGAWLRRPFPFPENDITVVGLFLEEEEGGGGGG